MKLTLAHLLLLSTFASSLSIHVPIEQRDNEQSLAEREAAPEPEPEPEPVLSDDDVAWIAALPNEEQEDAYHSLVKRKGGGGKGGGGGGGGSKSGSSSSGGSGGSSGSTRTPTSSFTNSPPTYGGGKSYAGGATRSYKAGGLSPGGIAPALVVGGAFGVGAAGLYLYTYPHFYPYYRNTSTNRNDSLPIDCVCNQNAPCGCDDTNNPALVQEMLKDSKVAQIKDVNGTRTVVINGTLTNGTTGAAAGSLIYSPADFRSIGNWWVIVAIVGGMVYGM